MILKFHWEGWEVDDGKFKILPRRNFPGVLMYY